MTAFTFVTVVFDAELDLLELQARSFRRHLDPALVHEILVIDNSRRGMPAARMRALHGQYGPHAESLRVLRPRDIVRLPGTTGWYAQQILKLAVADVITSEGYVVLDAKNHLVRTLEPGYLAAPDGRYRTSRQSFEGHRLEPDLRRTLDYFGLPQDEVRSFTPTITPFVLSSTLVRSMTADLAATSGRPFAVEFLRARLLEFFAYAAWLQVHEGPLDHLYVFDQPPSPTVWPKGANDQGLDTALERVANGRSPWFSVHRRALGLLDVKSGERLANLWMAAGLFTGPDAAEAFVRRARRTVVAGERRQRMVDAAPRAARLARRAAGRLRERLD